MRLEFRGVFSMQPEMLIRRCGYGAVRSRTPSWARRLSGYEFPRLHVYIDKIDGGFRLNLHLDQKAACHEGVSAHSGEYDGDLVEQEGRRLQAAVEQYRQK